MPLLEINQIRHICVFVRLDESTATARQVIAQYVAKNEEEHHA